MKLYITQGVDTIFLEEDSGDTIILRLAPEGVALYFHVSEISNLTLNEKRSNCIGIEE